MSRPIELNSRRRRIAWRKSMRSAPAIPKATATASAASRVTSGTASLTTFTEILLRLKQALGLPQDREIAAALGMRSGALCARKKRGSFPEDKLFALSAKRPDLGLDVPYILTGRSA